MTCEDADLLWRAQVILAACAKHIVAPDISTEATCDVDFACGSLVMTADYNTVSASAAVNLAASVGAATSTLQAASSFYGANVEELPLITIDVLSPSPPPPSPISPSPPPFEQGQEYVLKASSVVLIVCAAIAGTLLVLLGCVVLWCLLCRDCDRRSSAEDAKQTSPVEGEAHKEERVSLATVSLPDSQRSESPVHVGGRVSTEL
mmetsp:Transcript_18322/g.61603  ORF Transcript_18322/g.61603 Transcript_18322/m.61603 type:complete len:205 (+) Transcript_18322:2869-3483(+)